MLRLKPLRLEVRAAYQQGYTIAHNLHLYAPGYERRPAKVNLPEILPKLGLNERVANPFNEIEIGEQAGHLI